MSMPIRDAGHNKRATYEGRDDLGQNKNARLDGFELLEASVRVRLEGIIDRGMIRRDEMDNNALRELADFDPRTSLDVLDQFENSDMTNVRNRTGFLCGVMTRMRRQDIGPKQRPEVQQKLDALFRTKRMRASDLDIRCYDAMANAPPDVAISALERLSQRDLNDVRNPSAFFMSQLRSAEIAMQQGDPYARAGYDRRPPPAGVRPGLPPGGGMPPPTVDRLRRPYRGDEQRAYGVRVAEFHNLADAAPYVAAAVALKLQTLWDAGVRLVSLLDDRSWDALADLPAPEGLAAVDEVAAAMQRQGGLRNVNAFFMSVAGKLLQGHSMRGGPMGGRPGGYDSYPAPGGGPSRGGPGGYSGGRSYPPPAGSGGPPPPGRELRGISAMHTMPDMMRHRAEEIIDATRGAVRAEHFDEGVVSSLLKLGDDQALKALDEIRTSDMSVVRSIPAFIMGICKRYRSRY